jgi:hypothetical protein
MRDRILILTLAALCISSAALAQRGQRGQRGAAPATPAAPSAPHDPKDLSGVWTRQSRILTMSNEVPPMTPWGKEKFEATRPVYGPRAVPGGNDPISNCDPMGIPRNLFLEVSIYPLEIVQTPKRTFQFFEWAHSFREIWTDGRKLPEKPDPRWMGYSVGRWEGDTFVVETIGMDDRTWLDHFGNPVSEDMHLVERYRRLDRDTLELNMTITAPMAYTKPWVSETKIMKLAPPDRELQELFCVPSEEMRFNELVRLPAAGKTAK